jgi:hypothetical protein
MGEYVYKIVHFDFFGLLGGLGEMTALFQGISERTSIIQRRLLVCLPPEDLLDRFVKDALEIPLRQSRALDVLHRSNLFGHLHGLLVVDRRHLPLSQLLAHFGIISKIKLCADEYNGYARRMVLYFWIPLRKPSD